MAKESIGIIPSTPNQYSTPNTAPEGNKIEKVHVNFRPELKEIIKETKYLDKLGFMVPEAALNVALQVLTIQDALRFYLIYYHRMRNTTHLSRI